ncbi:MAG: D-2-hydroxyacid dehydrogenase [Flavobacteriales bacterium]|nr:D-2-hydroxyacid dehydrogenase [Flavobacteriales bacterium]
MKILANDGIAASGKTKLEAAGHQVITQTVPQDQLIEAINKENYEVVLVRSATQIRKDIIDACPCIKMIGRGGVGMDNIDVEYGRSKGIKVFNTPGASSQSVAELVFAHLFGAVRGLYDSNRQMPIKGTTEFGVLKKKYGKGMELRGKTLGVIGMGRIGQSVMQYGLGLGMKVIAHDPYVDTVNIHVEVAGTPGLDVAIKSESFDKVITESDILTLHVPKQKDGSAVIGAKEFEKMKKGVIIANAARGGVIDEDALINALNSSQVSVVCLDVYNNEPTPDHRLLSHPSISLTPHVGAATEEAQDRIGTELADFIIANA